MQAAARLVAKECAGMCTYEMTIDMAWSAENHPIEFPEGGAFFTPFFVRPWPACIAVLLWCRM